MATSASSPAIDRPASNADNAGAHPQVDLKQQRLTRFAFWAMALLPIMTFTVPGRPSPSALRFLDGLAFAKLAILMYVCLYGGRLLVGQFQRPLFQRVVSPMLPAFAFLAWAILSVAWSPLKAVTVGQAGGLTALIIYAVAISVISFDPATVPRILKSLAGVLLGLSGFVLVIHLLFPMSSGLDRTLVDSGADGVVHPTASGSTASLGILLTVMCTVIGRLGWSKTFTISSLLVHAAVLYYSNSRGSSLLAIGTAGMIVFWFADNRVRAASLIAGAVGLGMILLIDPGFRSVSDGLGAGTEYFARGQSLEQIREVSGRAEMWSAIWNEFLKSPIIGHGYFVTSEGGEVEVWNIVTNHTAHNVYLQVMASTGLIGLLLFAATGMSLFFQFRSLEGVGGVTRSIGWMLVFVAIWYFGWSMTCASFMGPVRTESVFFFTFIGLGIGQSLHRQQALLPGTAS